MTQFPGNSHMSRINNQSEEPRKKPSLRVVTSEVTRRKKPTTSRIRQMFGGEDGRSVIEYVISEVLLPAAKDMIADALKEVVERSLFGESRTPNRRNSQRSGGTNYTPYNRYGSSNSNTRRDRDEPRKMSRHARQMHDFDEIILATKHEAEELVDYLLTLDDDFDVITVGDLLKAVGVEPTDVDENWGWSGLRGHVGVTRLRGGAGYLIDIPKPESLID